MARILVVDDEPDLLALLQVQLTSLGHEVLLARDGAEGLRQAAERRPDVLLMDVIMPYMDGIEMLERLREDPGTRQLPVIAFSARSDPTLLRRLSGLGVRSFLPKPYALAELDASLKDAVGSAG